MRSSGRCSVMTASNSFVFPATFVTQWVWVSSSWRTSSTPSMNCGNCSNCVHWSYAVRTGTCTSMLCSMVDIWGLLVLRCQVVRGRATPVRAGGTARRAEARQVRRAVRDPVPSRMPLHLVTGPANAAKARRALDAQRAGAGAGSLLVVPRPADVEPYRRELAADGPRLRGVRDGLRPAPGDDRPSRRAPRPPAGRARARARRGRGRRADRPARAGRLGGDRRLPARAPAPRRRARGAPGRSGAVVARGARRGRRRTRPGPPTRRTSGRSTAPTATRWPASGAPTRSSTRAPRSTRCASTRRAGAARPSSSTASTTSRRSSSTRWRRWPSTPARTSW